MKESRKLGESALVLQMKKQMRMPSLVGNLEKDGFEVHRGLFSEAALVALADTATDIEALSSSRGGGRNIFSTHPAITEIFKRKSLLAVVERTLGLTQGLSEGLFLNKKVETNWLVAWHQDLFISVKSKLDLEGYSGWTMKQGRPYVQPPIPVLEQSLWVRLNLDDNDTSNGCLRVVPGSHRLGKIQAEDVNRVTEKHGEFAIPCSKGDVILFRPLLLHASSKSISPSRRRVFQVLYSGYQFQNGLDWPY